MSTDFDAVKEIPPPNLSLLKIPIPFYSMKSSVRINSKTKRPITAPKIRQKPQKSSQLQNSILNNWIFLNR